MTEKHYLLKVLGLSSIPKLITFGLTLLSFPLLLRSLGVTEYGVVLMIGAALAIFEVLIDFGVSSASGKAMASVRAHHPQAIRREFFAWARLQAFFVVVGFVPMLLAAWLMLQGNAALQFKPELLFVMSAAVVSQVALSFFRANLLSLLAFKSLAVLDTFESVLRSGGYLAVAFFYATAMGLALAGLSVSVVAASLALVMVGWQLSSNATGGVTSNPNSHAPLLPVSVKSRLWDSLNFLWLRLATRLFSQGPLLLVGRLLGPEVVGIMGVASKINDILSLPYMLVGNALMVRINELSRNGINALYSLWDTAFRIISTTLVFTVTIYLGSDLIAQTLLPESKQAKQLLPILILGFIPYTIACIIPAMSDYIGGLLWRTIAVTIFGALQLPLLWLVGRYYGAVTTIWLLVIIYTLMIIAYTVITSKLLFNSYIPRIRSELVIYSCIVFLTLLAVTQLKQLPFVQVLMPPNEPFFIYAQISLFVSIVVAGIWLTKKTRAFYFNSNFFEFAPEINAK
jgi:O-antigen/teichoic acid export membrane protein